MNTSNPTFYSNMILRAGAASSILSVPWVDSFDYPTTSTNAVVVLKNPLGAYPAGLYLLRGNAWVIILPFTNFVQLDSQDLQITVYTDQVGATVLAPGSLLYKNGSVSGSLSVTAGSDVWVAGVAAPAASSRSPRPWRFIGRNYPFGYLVTAVPTSGDIGGTTRKKTMAISPLSRVASLLFCHSTAVGTGSAATEDTSTVARNFTQQRLSYEYGGVPAYDSVAGRTTWVLDPAAPVIQTDGVGLNVAPNATLFPRLWVKPTLMPSSAGTVAASGTGTLAAQAWYYVVTRTERGFESGPQTEITGTTSGTNALIITIVDTRSASADYYTVYRSSAAAGTKQFLSRTAGPVKRFVDDGSLTVDTTINPPTAAGYKFNTALLSSVESTNHFTQGGGPGTDVTAAVGIFQNSGPSGILGVVPAAILGDDTSGKCILAFGDSINRGSGFGQTGATLAQDKNYFDYAIVDGAYHSCNASVSNTTLNELLSPTLGGGARTRLKLIQYADGTLCTLGTNDIGYGRTWTQLATDHITLGALHYAANKPYWAATILPRGTTTDAGLTTTNFTPFFGNATRINFNNWLRNGRLVDGSGTPVLTGGTSSPYITGYVELANTIEVNASNVLTQDGGYIKAPTAALYTGIQISAVSAWASSPYQFTTSTMPWATNGLVSMVLKFASNSSVPNQLAVVASNNVSSQITVYGAGELKTQSGVDVPILSQAPIIGDTFDIWEVYCNEGLHPALLGHRTISPAISAWLPVAFPGA